MTLRVCAILGLPASGKTSLMKRVIKTLGENKVLKIKTLVFHEFKQHKCIVLGKYLGEEFEGTDRLSMSVQPIAVKVMEMWAKEKAKNWTALFEGDRLGTLSFLEALKSMDIKLKIFMLKVDGDELDERHKERGDTQGETWLKGRMTKLANISEFFDGSITTLQNSTKVQLVWNRDKILEQVVGYQQ